MTKIFGQTTDEKSVRSTSEIKLCSQRVYENTFSLISIWKQDKLNKKKNQNTDIYIDWKNRKRS